eukprot:jgi/Botrbrau1/7483/Bobra.0095s0020.2
MNAPHRLFETCDADACTAVPNQAPVNCYWNIVASLLVVAGTVGCTTQSHCEALGRTHAGSRSWTWWPSLAWFKQPAQNPYILELQNDSHVGVVLAAALPYLTLSFGFFPSKGDMAAAEDVLCQQLSNLDGWELAAILWGATHLGYQPRNALAIQEEILRRTAPSQDPSKQTQPEDAALLLWALAVNKQLTPPLWKALLGRISSVSPETLSKVTLLHLYQAATYADPEQIGLMTSTGRQPTSGWPGAQLKEEVATKFGGAAGGPNEHGAGRIHSRCQAGQDLTGMMLELTVPVPCCLTWAIPEGSLPPQRTASTSMTLVWQTFSKIDKLLSNPFLLRKFQGEVVERRGGRQNLFVRQLNDISRTLAKPWGSTPAAGGGGRMAWCTVGCGVARLQDCFCFWTLHRGAELGPGRGQDLLGEGGRSPAQTHLFWTLTGRS